MKKSKRSISRLTFFAGLLLLLTIHIILGVVMMKMSKKELREQIEQRMLDIANTAAYQLNGDELKTLTAESIGTEPYNHALETLLSFQKNIQLDYIYSIREEPDGSFSFTIDPELDDPGEFGEPIETTDALIKASKGTPGVDKTASSDRWGRFYSAYSPVFDSEGNVAGIVGVDFNADWFDEKVNSHRVIMLFLIMITLTIVIMIWLMLHTSVLEVEKAKYRKQLEETLQREQIQEQALGSAREMAYTDPLTGVKSKRAYMEAEAELNDRISTGAVHEFAVIVCDLNGLKVINDTLGHEEGDNYIKNACSLICRQFTHSPVFRIGGDEFVVLLENSDFADRITLLDDFDTQIDSNLRTGSVVVSTGMDEFDPETDHCLSDVFERADKKMYARKRYLKGTVKTGAAFR
jgi:diguanylate cyclase (GGDEF)-like protein